MSIVVKWRTQAVNLGIASFSAIERKELLWKLDMGSITKAKTLIGGAMENFWTQLIHQHVLELMAF